MSRSNLDDLEPPAGEERENAAADDPGPAPRPSSPVIRRGDRAFAAGMTGEGKSELFLHLYAVYRGQRLLVDVKDHYRFGPAALAEKPPPLEVDKVRDIDWRHRSIRYVPRTLSSREFNDLYAAIFGRGDVLVLSDEMEDIAPSHERRMWPRKVIKQGRVRRITHLSTSQRPHGVERAAYGQAEHLFLFRMFDEDDLRALSYRVGVDARRLAALLTELPQHGYYRSTLGSRELVRMPPLPAHVITQTRRQIVNPR